jgi:hypothetical protein
MGGRRRQGALAPLEKAIQAAVVDHWRVLGLPNTLVAAIPNAGALGQPGLTCGLPDLLVMAPWLPGGFPVAFIELKRDPDSRVSDDQRAFGKLCDRLGIRWEVSSGRDDPIALLEAWGVVRRAAA